MPFPLVAKLALGGLGLYMLSSKKSEAEGPSSPSSPGAVPSPVNPATGQPTPIAQRMALVLGTGDPNAIRFEAGRLRQEGYPAQAAELEREAQKIDAARAAAAAAAAPHPAPAPAPVVVKPPVVVTSPGFVPQPVAPAPVPPPVVIQTPVGPVSIPQPAALPSLPVTIPTPAGPISLPSVPVPSLPQLPLPVLAHGEVLSTTSPGQTVSEKTRMVQAKLASLGLMAASDVIGKYGPKTESAVKQFQTLANVYLKALGKPVALPTAGETVTAIKVDGKWGNQTNDVAALAHAPVGTGSTASYFGSLEPLPATPLPGIVPPMAPRPIEPRMALASRVAHNLAGTQPGQEDRSLLQLFQAAEGLKASGRYNASTGATLATRYGIVPPRPPCDWTDTHTKRSKQNYKRALLELASKEPQRKEEWEQAARAVA